MLHKIDRGLDRESSGEIKDWIKTQVSQVKVSFGQ